MTYPYNGAPIGPISTPPQDRKQIVIVLAVVAALLLTFLGVGAAYMLTSSDGKVKATAAPDLILEASGNSGADPFSPSVVVSNRPLGDAAALAPQGALTVRGVEAVDGTTGGLYASGGDAVCDTAALANYLANNPAKAQSWASVFGISTAQIPYYLDTLTPVVLTRDTWVTNHSYSDNEAYAFQSVFQAGTAVLVDAYGVPRVRCACGNPLAPPAGTPIAGYRPVGQPWPHYGPRQVVYVTYYNEHTTVVNNTTTVVAAPNPAPAPAALTLIDLNTLQPLIRTVGGILNLEGLPPLANPLPTPAALNTPFTTDDPVLQAANGIDADGQPAPEVQRQAAEATSESSASNPAAAQGETPSESTDPVSSDPAVPAASGAPGAPSSSAAPAAPVAPTTSSSAAPTPTVFTGSGDIVSSLTFTTDNTSVTCTVLDPTQSTAELSCTDGVARTVSTSSLGQSSVTSSTDSLGVWTVRLTDPAGPTTETATITSAVWTLVPVTTVPPAPEAAPAPTETVAPTTETTTVTSEPATASSAPPAG